MTKINFFKTKMTIDYLKGCNLYFRLNIILSTIVNNFFPLFILPHCIRHFTISESESISCNRRFETAMRSIHILSFFCN